MKGNQSNVMPRGSTLYNGATIDSSNLLYGNVLGNTGIFDDQNPNTQVTNSNLQVKCILLRNKHSVALTPGQAIRFSTTVMGESGAPVSALSQLFGVVDEYLPAAGVPVNDVFWCVIGGPTTANIVTVSGAQAAGQLPVQSSTTSGKVNFTDLAPGSATIAQAAAGFGYRAFTEGAIADGATTARIILNGNFFGQ